jgi:hypothetical protein
MRLRRSLLPLALAALAGCGKIDPNDPRPRIETASAPGAAFGNTLLGTRKQLDFRLRNSDASFVQVKALTNIVVSVSGAGLSLGHSCPTELNEGESCLITVSYEPGVAGALGGELRVTSNAPDSPTTLALSGQAVVALDPVAGAVAFTATPSGDFGAVTVGQAKSVTYTVRNIGNAGDALTIAGPTLTGWTFSEDCPDSLAAASSCNVTVTFAPTATGVSVPPVLVISDPYNADYGGLRVNLSGTGS